MFFKKLLLESIEVLTNIENLEELLSKKTFAFAI